MGLYTSSICKNHANGMRHVQNAHVAGTHLVKGSMKLSLAKKTRMTRGVPRIDSLQTMTRGVVSVSVLCYTERCLEAFRNA
jgi:hypothetical protein